MFKWKTLLIKIIFKNTLYSTVYSLYLNLEVLPTTSVRCVKLLQNFSVFALATVFPWKKKNVE